MSFLSPKDKGTPDQALNNRQQFDQLAQAIQTAYAQAQRQPRETLESARQLRRQLLQPWRFDRYQRAVLLAYLRDAAGCARIELGQIVQGVALLEKAAKTYQTLPDKTPLVNNLLNQARAWLLKNDLKRGVTELERGLAAAREGRLSKTESDIFYKLGVLYNLLDQPDKATEVFGKGLLLSQQIADRSGTASFLSQFGQLYLLKDEPDRAQDYFERSRELFEQENDLENLMVSYGQLDQLARRRNDYPAALEYAEKGLALARQQADQHEENVFLQDLARIYLAQEDYPKATELMQESLALTQKLDEAEGLLRAYELLSQIATAQKDYPTAQQWIEQGYAQAKIKARQRDQAIFLNDLADLKLTEGDTATAFQYFEQLASLFKELQDWSTLTTLYVRMGDTYLEPLKDPQQTALMGKLCFDVTLAQKGQTSLFAFTSTMRLIQMLANQRYYGEGLSLATKCLEQANGQLNAKAKKAAQRDQSRWMLFAQVLIVLAATPARFEYWPTTQPGKS